MDLFRSESGCAADIVMIVRVAAVNDDIAGRKARRQRLNLPVDQSGRNHKPHRSGLLQPQDQIFKGSGADSSFFDQSVHSARVYVIYDTLMPGPHDTPNHIGAHPAQADHSKLHSEPAFIGGMHFAATFLHRRLRVFRKIIEPERNF
jgi:hypothetical protein